MTLRFPLSARLLARLEGDHAMLVAALPVLAELSAWAANYTPDNDGYGHGAGDGGSRGSDTTSSTERAALAGCSEAEMARIVEGFMAGCVHIADASSRLRAYVTPKEIKRGRSSSVDVCPCCDEPMPRPRSGFCERDYRQWVREDRPDRAWFVRRRRGEYEQQRQAEEQAARAAKAGKGAA